MALATLGSRQNNVIMKLGNRQDLLQPSPGSTNTYSRVAGWLRDAYISVSYEKTFEQTETTITFQTVQGQDTYTYPDTVRAIKSLVGQMPSGAPINVDWKDIHYIRRYSTPTPPGSPTPYIGVPSIVAPWATSVIFRPIPNGAYTFYMDCWMKPVITTDIISTQLQLPDDWLEVVDYEAALRGHVELLERDKADQVQRLLYGYTDPTTGARVHGVIGNIGNRTDSQKPYMEYGIQPKYRPSYTK